VECDKLPKSRSRSQPRDHVAKDFVRRTVLSRDQCTSLIMKEGGSTL
jgi:hypothetical protein